MSPITQPGATLRLPRMGRHMTSDAPAQASLVGADDPAKLTLAIGRAFHQAGIPVDFLEELMRDLAVHLGVTLQVNALPTSLTVAIGPAYAQRVIIMRLEPAKLHLRKLALLNELVDALRAGTIDVAGALAETERIDKAQPPTPVVALVFAYALLSLGVAILLGGGSMDVIVATLVGIGTGSIAAIAERVPAVDRIFEISAAFFATLIIGLFERFGARELSLYVVIIAGIVQLLPGLSLTTALHELANRNLVAGTARLGGVLVTLLSLTCGFALGVAVAGSSILTGASVPMQRPFGLLIVPAILAITFAVTIILHARPRDVGWVLASCALTIVISRLLALLPEPRAAAFGTALIVGLGTNIGARFLRIPQAILLVPGLYVLVPGSLSYESILAVFQRDVTDAVTLALNAVLASILIVSGLLLSQLLVRPSVHDGDVTA